MGERDEEKQNDACSFYNQAIETCRAKVEHLKNLQSEYGQVINVMERGQADATTLQVPIGSVATMQGQLIPDSDVLVLLGDNWFVESSSEQAVQIARRRLHRLKQSCDQLNNDLETLKSQRDEIQNGLTVTTTSAEAESATATADNEVRAMSATSQRPSSVSEQEFNALMRRLDELEAEEAEDDEELLDSDDEPAPATKRLNGVASAGRRRGSIVRFEAAADSQCTYSPDEPASLVRRQSESSEETGRFAVETVEPAAASTAQQQPPIQIVNDDGTSEQSKTGQSILRNRNEKSPIDADAPLLSADPPPKQLQPMSDSLFTGQIVERLVDDSDGQGTNTSEPSQPKKKKSLFAQRR